MKAIMGKFAVVAMSSFLFAGLSRAQTSSIEGDVKGEDSSPLRGALVKIERKDIKGSYKVKTDKKGHFFHTGLPLGMYRVTLEVDGKDRDMVDNVRTRLGDPTSVNFDLAAQKKRQDAMSKAADSGQLTREQERELSPEQRQAMERQLKERAGALAKNKVLNEAFNQGMEALKNKQWDAALEAFNKAVEMDAKQHVIWGNMAEAYVGLAGAKTGAEQDAAFAKGTECYNKAIELKPDDAAYHNNFALALAKQKKTAEAQAELEKAAQINPPGAGQYFYNLGAVLTNIGQSEAASVAFKRAIDADPKYANAQFQYAVALSAKITYTPDGKVITPPGVKEALDRYLELDPNGQFAEAAKGLLQSISSQVETQYTNPAAKKGGGKKK